MKTLQLLFISFLIIVPLGAQSQELQTIQGTITDGKNPIENVAISVEGSENRVFSDTEGKYSIQAEAGDLLMYSLMGMKDYIIRVEEKTRFLNVIMIPDVTELDEVTVTNSNRKSQAELMKEYPINKRLIRTAFGILDADALATNVRFLNEDEINPIGLCIIDLLRARFAGVRVIGNCQEGGRVFLRGGVGSLTQSTGVVYDVDGMILAQAPVWIDVNNIKRIAIIAGLAVTMKYGTFGSQGVIVINTKGFSPQWDQKYDMARLRNNFETGPVLTAEAIKENQPQYLTSLQQSDSFEAAQENYNSLKAMYSSSGYFFLDAYKHFSEERSQQAFADGIIEENREVFREDPNLMKALAFTYQSEQRFDKALELYKELFILRPHYSQSYMDLAAAYREAGAYDRAASMYARYKYLVDENFLQASEDFSKIIQHESDNLLFLHGDKIGADVRKIQRDPYVENTTRVVFSWTDMEAEFELQFVNPEGQYHTWKHTYIDNEDRLVDEKRKGYMVEEQIIDRSLPGLWKINVNYQGNKSLTPTYLKVTVYQNFGSRAQSGQTKVYKLFLKDVNQELFKIATGNNMVLNK
ncbi:carboxypeptidase-like regulatory domain-containing protein [Robiginitalea sp. IMCC44478]|uniref:carboxypeptidase-like regulatory domain-containing protein n=1 Tax=Robiginitalea sp. IMCC44478 TaxID=3459122 RepID=UPI0040416547